MDRDALINMVRKFPDRPGVYLMRSDAGEILYVGKARSLKKRVSSYFRHAIFASPRLAKLVSLISDISTIRTESEAEALVLESRLIKLYQPFFNVELKMGERYPFIKVTQEDFPRIVVTRYKQDDGAVYIGPFVKSGDLRVLMRLAERYFPLRTCASDMKKGDPPAARACLRHKLGLCLGPCVDPTVEPRYRERVADLILLLNGNGADLASRLHKRMDAAANKMEFEEAARLRDTIRAIWRVSRQHLSTPAMFVEENENELGPLKRLQEVLDLPLLPWRIDGFDISHTQGEHTVGVVVVFEQGVANRSLYRRFNIRLLDGGIDDFRSMEETLTRRYRKVIDQQEPPPQLILIDGGPIQLEFAMRSLEQLGMTKVSIASLAKRDEEIFVPGRSEPIVLDRHDPGLRLLQRVRDESHRFAITSHRRQREKKFRMSELENIPGLGKNKVAHLLTRFGSIRAIAKLSVDELAAVPGLGPVLAERIYRALDVSANVKEENDEGV